MTRRYHPVLVVLHWLLALMILGGLLVGGLVLAETPNDDPAKLTSLLLHMVSGLTILALMIGRLGLRLFTAKPPHADIGNGLLNTGASAAHWALYLLVIGMSVSGIVMSNTAGLPDIVFTHVAVRGARTGCFAGCGSVIETPEGPAYSPGAAPRDMARRLYFGRKRRFVGAELQDTP